MAAIECFTKMGRENVDAVTTLLKVWGNGCLFKVKTASLKLYWATPSLSVPLAELGIGLTAPCCSANEREDYFFCISVQLTLEKKILYTVCHHCLGTLRL